MESTASPAELTVLGWSVVLLLLQVFAQAFATYDLGVRYLVGPRDEDRGPANVLAGRLSRALRNLLETYPAFVALALALLVTGKAGGIAATGAWIWLIARTAYVLAYAAGVPVLRTMLWLASILGLALMLLRLMT
jgi:Predicted membrane protein